MYKCCHYLNHPPRNKEIVDDTDCRRTQANENYSLNLPSLGGEVVSIGCEKNAIIYKAVKVISTVIKNITEYTNKMAAKVDAANT